MLFDQAWFLRHQRALLATLNAPIIGGELRAALAIRRHDVGAEWRMVGLLPHAYAVRRADGSITADFRTHPKYAKRLYHEWLPLWRAMHAWDRFVAEPLIPAFDLGFNSLPFFPDAGFGNTTVDGGVIRAGVSEAWATIIAGAGTGQLTTGDPESPFAINSAATTNQFSALQRAILTFDSSGLTAAATITAAVLSLFGTTKSDGLAITPTVDVYTSTPAANNALANADFSQVQGTSQTGSPITFAGWSTSGYNDFTFNATGQGNVSKTGISKFGTRNQNYDVAAVAPTWSISAASQINANFADAAGTNNDPKLVVTFTLPSAPGFGRYALWQSGIVSPF